MITAEIKYKKTGIDWIPTIPEHWGLIRLRFLCSITTGKKNTENKEEEGIYPFFVRSQTIERINSYSFECEGILTAGDGVGVGKVFHYVNEKFDFHQRVYLLYNFTSNINGKFLFYYLQTFLITELMRYNSKSTVDSIRLPILKDFFIPIPPQYEQIIAIEYIDSQAEKIAHFIQTKQRFIELLKEQRQSIITNAVTKGIDEKAKMKETGIEWMPQIPEHWDIRRLRYVGQCQNGLNKGAEYFGTGFPFISYIDVYKNESLPFHVTGLALSSEEDRINYSVVEGDIFFTRTSETVDEIGFSSVCLSTIPNATFSGFLIRFRPNSNFLFSGFSKYFFRCQVHRAFFVKEMLLVTRASLSQNLLKNLPVLLPPIEEQKQIVNFIEAETRILDIAISKAEREIELIKEYREAMIAEAVTGKIIVNLQY